MRQVDKPLIKLYLALFAAITLNISLWLYSNRLMVTWPNVPEAPSIISAQSSSLGDAMMAYRAGGLALQNFGNVGEARALSEYNYDRIVDWFRLLDKLDPRSNFVPYLAAYYFSANQDVTALSALVHYLEEVGKRPYPGKWRWLAEAAYIARHRMNDTDEALRLAGQLRRIWKPGMPNWTQNMEPMLLSHLGDKDAAYLLMLEILKGAGDQMSASEYRSTLTLLCQDVLTADEAAINPVCR